MSTLMVENIPVRLREQISTLGLSLAEVSRRAGEKSPQRLKDVLAGRQKCPVELLARLDSIGVDISYVLTGSNSGAVVSEPVNFSEPGVHPQDALSVPMYDVEGAAGAGRSLEHETVIGHFPLTAEMVAQFGLADARLAGIRVRGDSMEPTLFDGDWTFVNLDDTNWSLGGVFLVWVSGELRIKRVQRLAGGAMYLISDNSHYEKEMIPRGRMQEVAVLGRVKTRLGDIS